MADDNKKSIFSKGPFGFLCGIFFQVLLMEIPQFFSDMPRWIHLILFWGGLSGCVITGLFWLNEWLKLPSRYSIFLKKMIKEGDKLCNSTNISDKEALIWKEKVKKGAKYYNEYPFINESINHKIIKRYKDISSNEIKNMILSDITILRKISNKF